MDDTRTNHGFHRLLVRPIIRKRGVEVKRLPECIIDEPMIKPVVKATDLRALLGHDEPPAKRFKQGNYKVDCKETPRTEKMKEYRIVEVPGEDLRVKLPLGIVSYRVEHRGFEYLLYLDGNTASLKYFEKRFL